MIIPLDIRFDLEEAREYYHSVERDFAHLKWMPNNDAVDIEQHKTKGVYGWGIQSNLADLSLACPPYHIHKNGSNIYRNTVLVYGFAQKLIELFPECRQLGLAIHPPGVEIGQHTDNDEYFKIHIPLYTTDKSYFVFGEEHNVMALGRMYLVETKYMHGTINNGDGNRVHLLFKLPRSILNQVRVMKGSL
jgi:hypothetical protein